MPDPNNNQSVVPPMVSPTVDIPPMPDLISTSQPVNQSTSSTSDSSSGSSAPSVSFPDMPVEEPKKKFGGGKGKIIATILGLFLLVGGVGTGAYLVLQNQNPNERAAGGCGAITVQKECNGCHLDGKSLCVWNNGACKVSAKSCLDGGGTEPAPAEVACPSTPDFQVINGTGYAFCGGCVSKCVRTDLLASGGCNVYVSNKCGTPIQYGGVKCVKAPTPALSGEKCNVESGSGYDSSYKSRCPDGASFDKTGICYHRTNNIEDGLCATYPGCLGTLPNPNPGSTPAPAVQYTCDSKGCSVKAGSYPTCVVMKYTCAGGASINGCTQNPQGPAQSFTFDANLCGKTQQIDVSCNGTKANFVTNVYPACVVTPKPPVTPPNPTPSPTPVAISCQSKSVFKDDSRNTAGAYYLTGNSLPTGSNVVAGQKLVFSIKPAPSGITNASLTITDQLSTSFTFLDSDSTCTYNSSNRTVSCNLTTTDTQSSFRVVVANNATGTLTNSANLTASGKTTTCNTSVIVSTPSPTPMITAQCQNVTAYSPTWTVLTATQLSQKKAGDVVNFCVVGSASAGIFDKAKFTINNVAQAETTTKRPNTQDYCQSYTIPANTYSYTITAQIHHATLGWK